MKRNKISMAFATVSPIGLTSRHCPPVPLSYEREREREMCYSLLFFLFGVFQQFYQLKCQELEKGTSLHIEISPGCIR
jgi:hypothetical protein